MQQGGAMLRKVNYSWLLALMAGLCGALPANASSAGVGNPSLIIAQNWGVVVFNQSGTRTTPPSCQVIPTRWAIDVTQAGGQAMVSLLYMAYSTGKQVSIQGTGSCPTNQSDTELVQLIWVN